MPRPRSVDPRTETVKVRLTPGEKARIGERAVAAGMDFSTFLRTRGLGEKPRGLVTPDLVPQRAPITTVNAVTVAAGVERQEVADEIAEALDDPTARETFVDRRTQQLMGERGMTSLVARRAAAEEWATRGTRSA